MQFGYKIEARGFLEASDSPPSAARFISNCVDCNQRKDTYIMNI